jgi:hypothetical protein
MSCSFLSYFCILPTFNDETYKNSISLYDTHMDTTPIYSDLSKHNQSIHKSVAWNKR